MATAESAHNYGLHDPTLEFVSTLLTDNHLHIKRINAMYARAEQIIQEERFTNIGTLAKPDILLCGTGSPTTTTEYMKHIRRLNVEARFYVADLSADTLDRSMMATANDPYVHFCQLNALAMPFEDESFQRIETDRFIQFFDSDQKNVLFSEWHRILKPGGIVTTRDHLISHHSTVETHLDRFFKAGLQKLGLQTYESHTEDISDMLEEIGFDYAIRNMKTAAPLNMPIPLIKHIVAQKK